MPARSEQGRKLTGHWMLASRERIAICLRIILRYVTPSPVSLTLFSRASG